MKKIWEKPKLVVLVRSHPEESVLTSCKNADPQTGPSVGFRRCQGEFQPNPPTGMCAACYTLRIS